MWVNVVTKCVQSQSVEPASGSQCLLLKQWHSGHLPITISSVSSRYSVVWKVSVSVSSLGCQAPGMCCLSRVTRLWPGCHEELPGYHQTFSHRIVRSLHSTEPPTLSGFCGIETLTGGIVSAHAGVHLSPSTPPALPSLQPDYLIFRLSLTWDDANPFIMTDTASVSPRLCAAFMLFLTSVIFFLSD